jgi:hypothetical protein
MRIEIIIFLIAAAVIFNIYTEGKYLKQVLSMKKYWQIGGVVLGALFIWWLFKKNPAHAQNILLSSNEYLKYLPVDKNTASMLTPILDFTSKHSFSGVSMGRNPVLQMPTGSQERIMRSGLTPLGSAQVQGGASSAHSVTKTKRSVSETKKKFVASRQNWKCGDCSEQLNAWFEVDHKIRLEYGGSNHVDNLVALCRECHGKKTTIENL